MKWFRAETCWNKKKHDYAAPNNRPRQKAIKRTNYQLLYPLLTGLLVLHDSSHALSGHTGQKITSCFVPKER